MHIKIHTTTHHCSHIKIYINVCKSECAHTETHRRAAVGQSPISSGRNVMRCEDQSNSIQDLSSYHEWSPLLWLLDSTSKAIPALAFSKQSDSFTWTCRASGATVLWQHFDDPSYQWLPAHQWLKTAMPSWFWPWSGSLLVCVCYAKWHSYDFNSFHMYRMSKEKAVIIQT